MDSKTPAASPRPPVGGAAPAVRPPHKALKRALIAALILAAVLSAAYRFRGPDEGPKLPTTQARKGEFVSFVRCRGELVARRSTPIIAPLNVPELRVVWLAPTGEQIHAGDTVVRFDPSSARSQIAEKAAALEEADTKLKQAQAEVGITVEQDLLDLANAEYEVKRAQLEVSKAEILSKIQAEQAVIALDVAQEKLKVQQATNRLHTASSASRIAGLARAREQAQSELDLTEYRLSRMEMKSPGDGIVVYQQNYSLGQNAREFQVGDQVWAGAPIGEIPDLNTLQMEGKLDEIDRGAVEVGDEVRIRLDALPELTVQARLERISPLTQQSFEFPPTKSFRAYSPIQEPDPRLRPGMAATMEVIVERIPDAVIVPAQAVFTKAGKPRVYVADADGQNFRAVEITVIARNPEEFAVDGLAADATIALVDAEDAP